MGVITADFIARGEYPPGTEGHALRGIPLTTAEQPGAISLNGNGEVDVVAAPTADILKPCGYDLTALISAAPQDGHEYVVTCPRCGSHATIRRT